MKVINRCISTPFGCCNVFNSICGIVIFLSCVSFMVVGLVGVFLIIFSITYQLSNDETERLRRFESTEQELGKSLFAISEVCLRLEGVPRVFAGWLAEQMYDEPELDTVIALLHPYYETVVKDLGEDITFGVWTHLYDGNLEGQAAFFYDYGEYVYTNISHTVVLDVEKLSDYGIHPKPNYTSLYTTSPRYAGADHTFYRSKHKLYEYWVGGSPYIPYMSFSIGTGLFPDLENVTGKGDVLAGNIWYGSTIASFSDYLKLITPPDTLSWLIEIKRDYLLAVSDELDGLLKDSFQSPKDYDKHPTIQEFSKDILQQPGVLAGIKSGEIVEFSGLNRHFMFKYWDVSDLSAEWLLVNSKPNWMIYRLSYLTVLIISICLLVLLCVGCCWFVFAFRVCRGFILLRNQMKKIDRMDLSNISFGPCPSCFTLMELRFLESRFLKMTGQLQEYKAFLPEFVLQDEKHRLIISNASNESNSDNKSEESEASTTVSSNGSGDNYSDGAVHSDGGSNDSSSHSSFSSQSSNEGTIFARNRKNSFKNFSRFSIGVTPLELLILNVDFYRGGSVSKIYECILSSLLVSKKSSGLMYDFEIYSISIILVNKKESYGLMLIRQIQGSLLRESLHENVRFFLARGDGMIGNLGCTKMKRFYFGGKVKDRIKEMKERIPYILEDGDENGSGGGRTMSDAEMSEFCIFVCENCMGRLVRNYALRACNESHDHQLGKSMTVKDDEWMYELEQRAKANVWEEYNRGTESFFKGDFETSKNHFQTYLRTHSNDVFTKEWIKKCEVRMESLERERRYVVADEEPQNAPKSDDDDEKTEFLAPRVKLLEENDEEEVELDM